MTLLMAGLERRGHHVRFTTLAYQPTAAPVRALPAERFPRVIEAAGPLSAHEDPESFYSRVIEFILAGVEGAAARRREARRSAPA
jgi:hypothetical protein